MFSYLLSNTLLAAFAALVVWLLARRFRPAPATIHALWLVVMLKLLSPFGLVYPMPLTIDAGEPVSAPDVVGPQPTYSLAPQEADELEVFIALLAQEEGAQAVPSTSVSATAAAPNPQAPCSNGPNLFGLLLTIWVVGAVAVAGRQCWATWRFARLTRRARPAPEAIVHHVSRLARQLGVRVPAVHALNGLVSPVVWALGRPVLLWPTGLENRLDAAGRDSVLLHELAHLRRGDHWLRWLEIVAAIVHWWNPIYWLARRQMRFHAELACDAWVMGTLPSGRRSYAEALLEVCSTVSRAAAPSPAVGVGGDGRRDFQRRLNMIMRESVPCRLSWRGKLAVAALAIAMLPGWVLAQAAPQKEAELELILTSAQLGDTAREAQLKALEAKIAELLKEVQALRGGKAETKPAAVPARIAVTKPIQADPVKVPMLPGKPAIMALPAQQGQVVIVRVVDGATGKVIKETVEKLEPKADVLKHVELSKVEAEKARAAAEKARADMAKSLDAARIAADTAKGIAERIESRTIEAIPSGAVVLSRATYKLPKEKAEALGAFIKANVTARVLELKVEGDSLTVTTTPELQRAISTFVGQMTGKQPTSAAPEANPLGVRVRVLDSGGPDKPVIADLDTAIKKHIELRLQHLKDGEIKVIEGGDLLKIIGDKVKGTEIKVEPGDVEKYLKLLVPARDVKPAPEKPANR